MSALGGPRRGSESGGAAHVDARSLRWAALQARDASAAGAGHGSEGLIAPGAGVAADRWLELTPVRASAVDARGPALRGPTAIGPLAVAAAAFGAVAIGRLAIGRAAIKRLVIEELEVRRLRAEQLEVVSERCPSSGASGGGDPTA